MLGAWLQRGEFFGVRGQRLFVIREGRGPVLMLLHGYPTSSWDWHRIWTPLTAHFTLVAPDLLDVALSDQGAATWSLPLPNQPSLAGLSVFAQFLPLEVDAQLQFVALTATNALQLTVGVF